MHSFPFKCKVLLTAFTSGCREITRFCNHFLHEIWEEILFLQRRKAILRSLRPILGQGYHKDRAREEEERKKGCVRDYEEKTRKQISRCTKIHREREFKAHAYSFIKKKKVPSTCWLLLLGGLCLLREWSQEGAQVFSLQWDFFSPGLGRSIMFCKRASHEQKHRWLSCEQTIIQPISTWDSPSYQGCEMEK